MQQELVLIKAHGTMHLTEASFPHILSRERGLVQPKATGNSCASSPRAFHGDATQQFIQRVMGPQLDLY